ncbi:TonB-dependent receptor [Catalinimonas alkaloidigena]|uniref:TonB-dependent receptor n=1 Tax=Catalinimonas alkaloidigena TaxID=1075417 RepID=UPI001C409B35|nr:TonB-dependent receptor [Catalinimonas alkaloidigena]
MAAQTGKLSGTVLDAATSEPIPFANVVATENGVQKGGATTDFEGNYLISSLVPGTYEVSVSVVGYQRTTVEGVIINFEKTRRLDIRLEQGTTTLEEVTVEYQRPLVEADNTSTGATLTRDQIQKLPTRSLSAIITTAPAVYSNDDGGALNIKGNRSDANQVFINGIKVIGPAPSLPVEAIEEISVITGGVPAQFGDATGGIINITTRSASNRYFGSATAETSRPFDQYQQDLAGATLSGPLLTRPDANNPSQKKTVLGFFTALQYQGQRDSDPPAGGVYVLRDELLEQIKQNPLIRSGSGIIYATDTVKQGDLVRQSYRPNANRQQYTANLSIDFQPTDNVLVTAGGNFDRIDQRADASGSTGSGNLYFNTPFNSENNSQDLNQRWNAFVRFVQNFRPSGENSLIKDAYYQVQADYGQQSDVTRDVVHKDNFMNYRYLGQFTQEYNDLNVGPLSGFSLGGTRYDFQEPDGERDVIFQDFQPSNVAFTPSSLNPTLVNYTQAAYNLNEGSLATLNDIIANRGLINGLGPDATYGLFASPGSTQNQYIKVFNEQYRLSALGAVTIGGHTIKAGFEYEQRVQASYTVLPGFLWSAGRTNLNRHLTQNGTIIGIDSLSDPNNIYVTFGNQLSGNPDGETGLYPGQSRFDYNLRQRYGIPADQYLSIDEFTPDQLSIDLFSADELQQYGIVAYQGYDYKGNRLKGSTSFRDFFFDEQNRPQDAYRPNYAAAFIQDKFEFEDIILNIGLRVDRFDANQPVLRDRNSLTRLITVGEMRNNGVDFGNFRNRNYTLPSTVGDDWVVYVDRTSESYVPGSNESDYTILGYREGDQFYDANGQEVASARGVVDVGGNGQVNPLFSLQGLSEEERELHTLTGMTLNAFEDYKPQIVFQPRIAFSFPISESAAFFAHYDVRAQRPGRVAASPSSYYFLNQTVGPVLSNPNLKPERLIDYQVGFQQVLSPSSALKLSAFYSELKDQIQIVNLPFAYPKAYRTFDNIDFQTSKGLTVQYDLRRTNHLQVNASYTLQFAEGTGSSDVSALSITEVGDPYIRLPRPLNFDQRHAFKITLDYRYATGEGPLLFGKPILENAGVNFFFFAGSGTPFTRTGGNPNSAVISGVQQRSQLEGSINASRMPWNIRSQLRIDKSFVFQGEESKRAHNLNVYVYVQNLLDRRNWIGVYAYTGNPRDDGFLNSGVGQEYINRQADPQAFQELYRVRLARPDFYSLPRRIRLGVAYSF